MATTISNPATFSSVRAAFSAEGYGSSTSFYAYRQGGGIVPATSDFNQIGAGTSGDPLQLSQFNGFTVRQPYLDSKVLTIGAYFYFNYSPYSVANLAYWIYAYSNNSFPSNLGSISPNGNLSFYNGAQIQYLGYNNYNNTLALVVQGNHLNDGWTTMNIGGYTYNRIDGLYAYISNENVTRWWYSHKGGIPSVNGATTTVTWN